MIGLTDIGMAHTGHVRAISVSPTSATEAVM